MGLFDIFGKKDVENISKGIPYLIKTFYVPVRLPAHKPENIDLHIKIKNLQREPLLTSVVVEVPKSLGLDQSAISKVKELRLGYLGNEEEKEVIIPIWGTVTTDPGEYSLGVTTYCHYRTYAYILNSVKKSLELRVV